MDDSFEPQRGVRSIYQTTQEKGIIDLALLKIADLQLSPYKNRNPP